MSTTPRTSFEIGEEAKQDKSMFIVMDTKEVYAKINISESDLIRVQISGEVILSVFALGKKEFKGQIKLISPVIDEKTRMILASHTSKNRTLKDAKKLFFDAYI